MGLSTITGWVEETLAEVGMPGPAWSFTITVERELAFTVKGSLVMAPPPSG